MKSISIYTDGACSGNPGPGGIGIVLKYKKNIKKISEYYPATTNNKMELLAVIRALQALKEPCEVNLYSDSKYVCNAINLDWIKTWKKNNWTRAKNKELKNNDLWQQIDELIKIHDVNFIWVKGHSDNFYNNECDKLAVEAIKKNNC